MSSVSFEGTADVVAGQGGLRTGVAQQVLDVAQRDALIEPTVPTVRRSAGTSDACQSGGAGYVAVHRSPVHARARAGAQQWSAADVVRDSTVRPAISLARRPIMPPRTAI